MTEQQVDFKVNLICDISDIQDLAGCREHPLICWNMILWEDKTHIPAFTATTNSCLVLKITSVHMTTTERRSCQPTTPTCFWVCSVLTGTRRCCSVQPLVAVNWRQTFSFSFHTKRLNAKSLLVKWDKTNTYWPLAKMAGGAELQQQVAVEIIKFTDGKSQKTNRCSSFHFFFFFCI